MNFPDDPMLQVSLDVYRSFPELTTDLLPDECLNAWTANHISEAYQNKVAFGLFMPIYSALKVNDKDAINKVLSSTSNMEYESDLDELNAYYTKFQQTLMAEQVCRQLNIKMKPVMIFDIPHYLVVF